MPLVCDLSVHRSGSAHCYCRMSNSGDEPALATRNHMGLNKHHGLVTIMIVIIDKMVMIVRRHAPVACRHRIRRGRVLFSVGRGDASAESGLQ
jgi:hypothetical protein